MKTPAQISCGLYPWGALVFEVGYHPRKKKKIMYLGLFFRTIQCTCVHRLGVQKRPKLEKKGVFLAILTSLGKEMTDKLRKTHAKTCIGFIFIPEKYVFRVCFESPFTRMISSLKYKWPPGAIPGLKGLYLKLL